MYFVNKSISIIGHDFTGYILVFSSTCLWYLGLMIGSELTQLSFAQIGVYIGLGNIVFNYLISRFQGTPTIFSSKSLFKLITLRHLLFAIQTSGMNFTLRYIPSPIVYTVTNANPLFIFLLDHFKNKTPIQKKQMIGVIISLLGIIVVVNSDLILYELGFSQTFVSQYAYIETNIFVKTLILIIFFFTVFGFAYGVILIKDINMDINQLNMHMGYISLIWNLPLLLMFPNSSEISVMQNLKYFLIIGFLFTINLICYNAGLKTAKKIGVASMMDFTAVIIGYLVSIFKYKQNPNILGLVGSLFIFIGLIFLIIK